MFHVSALLEPEEPERIVSKHSFVVYNFDYLVYILVSMRKFLWSVDTSTNLSCLDIVVWSQVYDLVSQHSHAIRKIYLIILEQSIYSVPEISLDYMSESLLVNDTLTLWYLPNKVLYVVAFDSVCHNQSVPSISL